MGQDRSASSLKTSSRKWADTLIETALDVPGYPDPLMDDPRGEVQSSVADLTEEIHPNPFSLAQDLHGEKVKRSSGDAL